MARITRLRFMFLAICLHLMAVASTGYSGNWPGWRGPSGLGYSDEKDLPLRWNGKKGENILWRMPLAGGGPRAKEMSSPGYSSPIVWGERVFITTVVWADGLSKEERKKTIPAHHVLCYQSADGKLLWDTTIPSGKCIVDNESHGYAVPTPITDGEHVFVMFGSGVVACLDFDGKIVWREELPKVRDTDSGVCSSLASDGQSIFVVGLNEGGLRALSKKDGKLNWEQKKGPKNRLSTPILLQAGERPQLIHLAGGIQSFDPATGDLFWSCKASTEAASPAFGSGLIYADSGRGGKTAVIVDPAGKGDVTKTHVRHEVQGIPGAGGGSPIIIGDHVFRACDPGMIKCWNMTTGELAFEERVQGVSTCSSPVATSDGRIYFSSPVRTYVIKAEPVFELLAKNELETEGGSQDYSSAALSGGRIYLKGRHYLWCIGKK